MATTIKIFGKSAEVNLNDKLKEDKTFKLQDRISFRGLDIAIENKKGSIRRGVNDDGTPWGTKMFYDYGYIQKTEGVDGDKVDCFIGPNKESDKVFIVHQLNPETKKYDEDKVMLGFDSRDYARAAYLAHYDTYEFLGKIDVMNFEEFKKKAVATKKKPGMIKSFGKLLKAFGAQLGMFDQPDHDIVEGETRIKNGQTYEIRRSKKNPNVKRLFKREETENKPETKEGKPKPKLSLFGQQVDMFGKREADNEIVDVKLKTKLQQKKSEIPDLFSPEEESARPTKQDKNELIENFGVAHLDSRIRTQRIELNKKVKELLASKRNNEFTAEDKKLLAQYSGRGGTDEISLNEFYTPEFVAKFQWQMLEKLGFKGGPVLEPSCATGIFLHTAPENALITGVEFDATSSRIASILFPQHEIYNTPFEKFNSDDFDKEFKAAIGNVPFGQRGETAVFDPEKAKEFRLHEQYFLDGILDDLGEGGLASIIVPTGIMDNQTPGYRLELNKKGEFLGAIRMPTGVFKNANAQVTTDIVFFKKRPEAVIEALNDLKDDELSKLYDTMILDAEFVNGSFFSKNPGYVLGEETTGQFGMKIWKGNITPDDLERTGDLIKNFETDYSILGDIGLTVEEEKELHVGDIITRNGRNYQLNENHRWERLDNIGERKIYLPEDQQKLLGIKTFDELMELKNDKSRLLELSREQLKSVSLAIDEELEYYTSSNVQKNEMLKQATVLGLAIKDFQTKMQRGVEKQYSIATGAFTEYEPVSTSDAQREAQQLAMLLEDFKERYGHPSKDAKLNAQMGKSPENPMLYLVSAFDSEGNLSKLFTDPKSFYNVYHSKVWTVESFNPTDFVSIISSLKDNGLNSSAEAIKSRHEKGNKLTLNEFKKYLFDQDDVFIDEDGEFNTINEVCVGEVYSKLDYWDNRINQNKKELIGGKITDDEKEVLTAENQKLEEQILEMKRRAEVRTLEDLPVDLSDAASGFFDIKYINDYLKERLGDAYKGDIIYNKNRKLFTFGNKMLDEVYTMHIAKGELDKKEKQEYEWAVKDNFNGEKNHISMTMLDLMNGFSTGTAPDYVQTKAKDIEQRFKTYLSETAENREAIENKYNREYNNFIQKSYDNSVIEGLSKLDYDKIVATDKNGNPVKVRDQIKGYNYASVRRMYEQSKGLIAHGVGLGKAQPLDALILTPEGYVRMGDVHIGQEIINSKGETSRITGIFPQGILDAFEVEFNDGSRTVCNDEHLWAVRTLGQQRRGAPFQIKTLKEIMPKLSMKGKHRRCTYRIPMVEPINFVKKSVKIEPYLLGLLLGDGSITNEIEIIIGQNDQDMVKYCNNSAATYNTKFIKKPGRIAHYKFVRTKANAKNDLRTALVHYGLMGKKANSKSIPRDYLLNDINTRLSVLQGLIDTDGYLGKDGVIQYTTVSKQLKDDVKFLVNSLGGIAIEHAKQGKYRKGDIYIKTQIAYTLNISLPSPFVCLRNERKLKRFSPREKYPPNRLIKTVRFVGKQEMQCISVDSPDHLYITNDMVLTHNTVQALLLGALSKETGRANKVTYVVPKSVAGNWNAEIKKWFKPDTKVLIIGSHRKEDANGKAILDNKGREQWVEDNANEKKVKLSRLVNEDFDFIIMTRDFYGDIRMNPQTADNMINELVDKFYVSKGDENDKLMEKKRDAIKFKLANEFLGNIKKDKLGNFKQTDEIYFENLGIDLVVADEAHSYKNLIESVLYSDIKYLNVKHSQRATDFYFKSKIIRSKNNDRGIYTMTAVPISNSPIEAFNMLLPIAEKEFERMGINNVDDFVKKFAEVDGIPTMSAAAKIVKKNVFTKFKNLNLLRKTFFRYTDYKTAEMVGAEVHFPKERPNFIFCEQSEEQKQIMKGLKLRLLQHEFKNNDMDKLVEDGFITEKEKEELKAYAEVHREKQKKLSHLAKTPDGEPIDFYFNILDDMKKATADLEWYAQAKSPWADAIPEGMDYTTTPKVLQLVDDVITSYKDGGKQLVFATNVNLHEKLKTQFVKAGIKPEEILIVNGGTVKSSDSRLKASEEYNDGKYKVVVGNYETMGEGLNFNIGTTAINHLQPAWNSLVIDEGNGRGVRQGNVLDNVDIRYYLTKGTIDAFFNQKILDKRGFVNSILTGKDDVMENDEGGVSADEIQIALAEDPEQARKLLQRKNEAFVKLMKERKVRENYGKLDNLFILKTRLARMKDKESLAYKALETDVKKVQNELNGSDAFEHKDILKEANRPIILPQHNAVVKVGSVLNIGATEKAIVSNYAHSTGKITLKIFSRYEAKTLTTDIRTFGNSFNQMIQPAKENAEHMFNQLITRNKTANINVIEALPNEIYKRYKQQILANMREGYDHYVIARTKDGNYVGTTTDFAFENDYDIILPQETTEYFNVVDKAVKNNDSKYDKNHGHYALKSTDLAQSAAKRFYGDKWESKIKYLKQKAKGDTTSEVDDLENEEAA